jgi:hypothetical protein
MCTSWRCNCNVKMFRLFFFHCWFTWRFFPPRFHSWFAWICAGWVLLRSSVSFMLRWWTFIYSVLATYYLLGSPFICVCVCACARVRACACAWGRERETGWVLKNLLLPCKQWILCPTLVFIVLILCSRDVYSEWGSCVLWVLLDEKSVIKEMLWVLCTAASPRPRAYLTPLAGSCMAAPLCCM